MLATYLDRSPKMSRLPLLLLLLAASPAWPDSCDLTLDEVLDRYVEARGGAVSLEEQTALRLHSTNHEGKWNPKFDYRTMKPGYMWIRATYDDGISVEEGFDGVRGWEKWDGKPAEYVGGDANKGLSQGAMSPVHLYGLNHMEELGAEAKTERGQLHAHAGKPRGGEKHRSSEIPARIPLH